MPTDFSALDSLYADLTAAPAESRPFVEKALHVTAIKVRDDWRRGAARNGLRAYARSVGYDIEDQPGKLEAEIGPTPGKRQASFGFVEEANGGVRSAPQHAGRDALQNNEQDFVDGIEKAVHDGLRNRGL